MSSKFTTSDISIQFFESILKSYQHIFARFSVRVHLSSFFSEEGKF